jgi:hypothetical protein
METKTIIFRGYRDNIKDRIELKKKTIINILKIQKKTRYS